MDGWYGDGHMGFMWLWWILGIALIVVVAWLVARAAGGNGRGGQGGGSDRSRSPEDILKERYARGEIDDEEYRRRLDELRR